LNLMPMCGSKIHLHRIVINLIMAAMDTMPNGGTITVMTYHSHLYAPLQGYEEISKGDYAVPAISNSGGGVSWKHIKHIFEPFYMSKQMKTSGSGVELAVVWGVVKDHNGYVDVHSEKDRGITFRLYFPVMKNDLPEVTLKMIASTNESIDQ